VGFVIVLVILGTSIWVAFDAGQRDWRSNGFANRPWKWVAGSLLLWIVVFPMYLVQRNKARPKT
jgi:hypothetical protein